MLWHTQFRTRGVFCCCSLIVAGLLMSVLLTAKFIYISTLIYSASYLKLTVKLMSGFEMCDIKNDISSMDEKKIHVFNKEWLDKCCFAIFSYLNRHSLCGVRSKEGEGIFFMSSLSPFSLPSHTQQGEKDLQEGVSREWEMLHPFCCFWVIISCWTGCWFYCFKKVTLLKCALVRHFTLPNMFVWSTQ